MKILLLTILLIPTICFAQYTKIDNQTFQKEIIVTVDYERLKEDCSGIRKQEQELIQRASEIAQVALQCESEIETLEGQGAKPRAIESVIEEPIEIIK